MPIRPALRRAFKDPELSAEFGDLVAWRDRIYRKYRRMHLRGVAGSQE